MIFIREHFLLLLVFVLSIFISISSYIALRNVFPTYTEILLGHTLYAVLALPNSFYNMVGLIQDEAAKRNVYFYISALIYWAVVITTLYWYKEEEREAKYVFVIAFFLLTGSVKWLYFAIPMIYAK